MKKAFDYEKISKKFKDFLPFHVDGEHVKIDINVKIKGIGDPVTYHLFFNKNENAMCFVSWDFSCSSQVGDTRKESIVSVLEEILIDDKSLYHDILSNGKIHCAKHKDFRTSSYSSSYSSVFIFESLDSSNFIEIAKSKDYRSYYSQNNEWLSFFYDEEQEILSLKSNKQINPSSKNIEDFNGIDRIHFDVDKESNVHYGFDKDGFIFFFKKNIKKENILLFQLENNYSSYADGLYLKAELLSDSSYHQKKFSLFDIIDVISADQKRKDDFISSNLLDIDNLSLPIEQDNFIILHALAFGDKSEKLSEGDFVEYKGKVGSIIEEGLFYNVLFEGEFDYSNGNNLSPNVLTKINFSLKHLDNPFLALLGSPDNSKRNDSNPIVFVNVIAESEDFYYVSLPKYVSESHLVLKSFMKFVHSLNTSEHESLYFPYSYSNNSDSYSKEFERYSSNISLFDNPNSLYPIKKEFLIKLSTGKGSSYDFVNNIDFDVKNPMVSSVCNFLMAFEKHDYMKLSSVSSITFSILFYLRNSKNDFLKEFHLFTESVWDFEKTKYNGSRSDFSTILFNMFKNAVRIFDVQN